MKTFKLSVHSVIDLITNSSTEIFVDFSNSIKPVKELVNEFLKVQESDKTCDDIFDIRIENAVQGEDPGELVFTVKDSEYSDLARLIEKVLFSVETNEYYC